MQTLNSFSLLDKEFDIINKIEEHKAVKELP